MQEADRRQRDASWESARCGDTFLMTIHANMFNFGYFVSRSLSQRPERSLFLTLNYPAGVTLKVNAESYHPLVASNNRQLSSSIVWKLILKYIFLPHSSLTSVGQLWCTS